MGLNGIHLIFGTDYLHITVILNFFFFFLIEPNVGPTFINIYGPYNSPPKDKEPQMCLIKGHTHHRSLAGLAARKNSSQDFTKTFSGYNAVPGFTVNN